jgi:hypothetical protein
MRAKGKNECDFLFFSLQWDMNEPPSSSFLEVRNVLFPPLMPIELFFIRFHHSLFKVHCWTWSSRHKAHHLFRDEIRLASRKEEKRKKKGKKKTANSAITGSPLPIPSPFYFSFSRHLHLHLRTYRTVYNTYRRRISSGINSIRRLIIG